MLEISLITVLYKRIGKFWYITQSIILNFVNSCFNPINYEVYGIKLVFVYRSTVEIPSNSIKYAKIN
jgi:hypothetical protein